MSALPFNVRDSIHVLYGIHAGVSPAYLHRRLVGVGLPCYHANGSPPDEMNQNVEQGAMSWTLYDHAHLPLSTCFTFQHSARLWEIGGGGYRPGSSGALAHSTVVSHIQRKNKKMPQNVRYREKLLTKCCLMTED